MTLRLVLLWNLWDGRHQLCQPLAPLHQGLWRKEPRTPISVPVSMRCHVILARPLIRTHRTAAGSPGAEGTLTEGSFIYFLGNLF